MSDRRTCINCGRYLEDEEQDGDWCWPCAFDETQELAVINGAETYEERMRDREEEE